MFVVIKRKIKTRLPLVRNFLKHICMLALFTTSHSAFSATEQQQVYIDNCSVATVGSEFSCDVMYTTSDNNETLTGLGLLIYFNAEKLEWLAFDDLLNTDLIGTALQPSIDSNDTDNDINTTHYLNAAWASLSGNWPNQSLPTKLYSIRLKVKTGVDTTETTPFRFSSTATSLEYDFSYTPFDLQIVDVPINPAQSIVPIILNLLLDD